MEIFLALLFEGQRKLRNFGQKSSQNLSKIQAEFTHFKEELFEQFNFKLECFHFEAVLGY